jgi:hypothetical protein
MQPRRHADQHPQPQRGQLNLIGIMDGDQIEAQQGSEVELRVSNGGKDRGRAIE